jgi:hypothetical protein
MTEGWCGDDYFILFSGDEVDSASSRYEIEAAMPGHQIVGLVGWDDFILRSEAGSTFRVPTVPLSSGLAAPYIVPTFRDPLVGDSRFTGKVKWYVKPIAFGGDPIEPTNIVWVTPEEHSKLVNWWNTLWRDVHRVPSA